MDIFNWLLLKIAVINGLWMWQDVFPGDIFKWLLAGLKSRRKCANFGLQESAIDSLLAGLKSRKKCANFGLQGSVIDGLWGWNYVLMGYEGEKVYWWVMRVKRCIPRGHFQLVFIRLTYYLSRKRANFDLQESVIDGLKTRTKCATFSNGFDQAYLLS